MMKQYIYLGINILLALFISCKNGANSETNVAVEERTTKIDSTIQYSPEMLENGIMYEANIRQYSPEGTFNAFTKDIPQLKELGVNIIWLMPVYPISTTKSKGSLGSYYAISDYTGINPEFGTKADLDQLVQTAHDHGMLVILDWVANHTGWDHTWIQEHPDYYTQNEAGEVIHPVNTDWTDVADLNYDNPEMRTEMRKAMQYWIREHHIDGYRCDVAGSVPVDFWEPTVDSLREIKPILMLAEAWEPNLMEDAFDMAYGWDTHHVMNDMAQGKKPASAWAKRVSAIDSMYQKDDILLNFVTNHDENSWNGTVEERMGKAQDAMLAFSYCIPGMPLIYSGQEYGMKKRLRFFEKDTIPKTQGHVWNLLERLGELKSNFPALHGGKNAASYTKIETSQPEKVIAFQREKDGKQLVYVANMSATKVQTTVNIDLNNFTGFGDSNQEVRTHTKNVIELEPWAYSIWTKNE